MNTFVDHPQSPPESSLKTTLPKDFKSGIVVALVALPLCLGIALASKDAGVPLMSGLIAGIVGGLVISWVSGSKTSVSGPAAGLTAVVSQQVVQLGSFDAFLSAVVVAGLLQIGLSILRAGSLAGFFPSSVIRGLLAAIGVILILKQIPHLFGHDPDWIGDMNFQQNDGKNTFSELIATWFDIHPAATLIGLISAGLLWAWPRTVLQKIPIPAPLVVVVGAVVLSMVVKPLGTTWVIGESHLVQVPADISINEFVSQLNHPNFSALIRPDVWLAGLTICVVASLETLLNLEAVDKIDPQKRISPPNRELFAQGIGNMTSGLLGGLPVTSVIVRSSVNVSSGGQTRAASFIHGVLLVAALLLFPKLINQIPLSCLAAILIVTGFKLANPKLFLSMWRDGRGQFIPFILTVSAIVFTDLLTGILIGLVAAIIFILYSNLSRPVLREELVDGAGVSITRLTFGSHVSFLNRALIHQELNTLPRNTQALIDARRTEYIDNDVLNMLREFERDEAPVRGITLSLLGFKDHYLIDDKKHFLAAPTRDLQKSLSPQQILTRFSEGNERFARGESIHSDPRFQRSETAEAQYPLAVVLSCMDSRLGTELIFDAGIGEAFSVKVAGNVVSKEGLGSIELGCLKAGARLIIVLGHTGCSMIKVAVESAHQHAEDTCEHIHSITSSILKAQKEMSNELNEMSAQEIDYLSELNVQQSIKNIREQSPHLRTQLDQGNLLLVGGVYDVKTGEIRWIS